METDWLDTDCLYVDKRDRVGKVHGWLRREKRQVPVICDDGRPFALVDERATMRKGYHSDEKLEKLMWPVPVLTDADDKASALRRFAECHAPCLPVHQGDPKREAGVLWAQRLLEEFDDGPDATACLSNVTTLGLGSDINRVIRGFSQDLADRLPVVGPKGPVGVVHRQDALRWVHEANLNMGRDDRLGDTTGILAQPITSMIDNRILTVDAEAKFAEVQAALREVPTAFVVRGNRMEGVLTPAGVLAAVHRQQMEPAVGVPRHFTLPKHR